MARPACAARLDFERGTTETSTAIYLRATRTVPGRAGTVCASGRRQANLRPARSAIAGRALSTLKGHAAGGPGPGPDRHTLTS